MSTTIEGVYREGKLNSQKHRVNLKDFTIASTVWSLGDINFNF